MEDAFNSGNATWEITRYAGVNHGFTVFDGDAYNLVADARSWDSMLTTLQELVAIPQTVDGEGASDAPGASPTDGSTDAASGAMALFSKSMLGLVALASYVFSQFC